MEKLKMKFYDLEGNTIGEVDGLTDVEVKIIYKGIISAVQRGIQSNNKNIFHWFNINFPTVWNEDGSKNINYN